MDTPGYWGLTNQQIKIADEFYERIKKLPLAVVLRYKEYITPKKIPHFHRIAMDKEFRENMEARRGACLRLKLERILAPN